MCYRSEILVFFGPIRIRDWFVLPASWISASEFWVRCCFFGSSSCPFSRFRSNVTFLFYLRPVSDLFHLVLSTIVGGDGVGLEVVMVARRLLQW